MKHDQMRITAMALVTRVRGVAGWQRKPHVLVAFGLLVALLATGTSAVAAQIDITNCQPKRVKICSYDYTFDDTPNQSHLLPEGDTNHFTCHANCIFWIMECPEGSCQACQSGKGHWLDHSWGKGAYHLVSLAQTGGTADPSYKSSDLVKVDAGTPCS